MGLSGISIHGVTELVLTDEHKIEKTGSWVRTLKIKHDGGTTSIDLFGEHKERLKVIPR